MVVVNSLLIVLRGILLIAACTTCFAVCGGMIATVLNSLLPGYYPGVFPEAGGDRKAAIIGILTGNTQGLLLGVFVGVVMAVGLACVRQLRWSFCRDSLLILAASAIVFAMIGAGAGLAIAMFMPDYYRSVISGGRRPDFNPIDVGTGLGCSQGIIVGVFVGTVLAVAFAGHRWRARRLEEVRPV
jgi:hypothetical protein